MYFKCDITENNDFSNCEFEKIPAVYVITNRVNGKHYVGETIDLDQRIKAHLRAKKQIIHKALKKYGVDQFSIRFIYLPELTKEMLLQFEEFLIKSLDSQVPNGYNICAKGIDNIGRVISEDTRHKMSISQKNRYSDGGIHPRKGRLHSESTKQKMRQVKLGKGGERHGMYGKTHTDEVRMRISTAQKNRVHARGKDSPISKAVTQFSIEGNPLNVFCSATEAEQLTGINKGHISKVCNGYRKLAGGFGWQFN